MATYALIHGGGDSASSWRLVGAELMSRGHDVVAVDLPTEDGSAGWSQYADVVAHAVGDRPDVVVVGHSLGGFTAPVVCARTPADLLVLVAGMVPAPGESAGDWWPTTGHDEVMRTQPEHDEEATFFHDVPPDLTEAARAAGRDQSEHSMSDPWPLAGWPDVPTRFLLCRQDRLFPAAWLRGLVQQRLGIAPDEIDCGHYAPLARPVELAERLHAYHAAL